MQLIDDRRDLAQEGVAARDGRTGTSIDEWVMREARPPSDPGFPWIPTATVVVVGFGAPLVAARSLVPAAIACVVVVAVYGLTIAVFGRRSVLEGALLAVILAGVACVFLNARRHAIGRLSSRPHAERETAPGRHSSWPPLKPRPLSPWIVDARLEAVSQ